ncbi:MAG: sigma-54-dependent Fis family transcriptional regulator, partial [Pseudomonadota bacterium]|nr:sigma-54-dependent Fis family transcriptional regulator [Pseudomonadota bacterium]
MRLLIVGTLAGHISAAGQIAIGRGAKVSHVETVEAGLTALRNGRGADLVMIDVRLSAPRLLEAMKAERINTPVVACGIDPDPEAAEAAIRAGAKEYIPLPPDAELIAAVLAAVSEDQSAVIH